MSHIRTCEKMMSLCPAALSRCAMASTSCSLPLAEMSAASESAASSGGWGRGLHS